MKQRCEDSGQPRRLFMLLFTTSMLLGNKTVRGFHPARGTWSNDSFQAPFGESRAPFFKQQTTHPCEHNAAIIASLREFVGGGRMRREKRANCWSQRKKGSALLTTLALFTEAENR